MRALLLLLLASTPSWAGQANRLQHTEVFHLNEGSGSSSYGANFGDAGTITNMAWVTGRFGTGLTGSSSNPRVAFPHRAVYLPTAKGLTFCVWLKLTAGGNNGYGLMGSDTYPSARNWDVIVDARNTVTSTYQAYIFQNNTTSMGLQFTQNKPEVGKWIFLCFAYTGGLNTAAIKMYLNGKELAYTGGGGTISGYNTATSVFYLGGDASGDTLVNTVSDEGIFRSWYSTGGEIQHMYLEGLGRHSD